MFENYQDILSVTDLCDLLRIGKNSAYKLLQTGEIPSFLIAGKYRIPKNAIVQLIENQKN